MSESWDSPRFTCDYSQPEEYRFSLDSILLAKAAAWDLNGLNLPQRLSVLDLCAGAGVIGFEFSFYFPRIQSLDAVEVQEAYRPHYDINKGRCPQLQGVPLKWRQINYSQLTQNTEASHYDVVLCNPPYFERSQGKIPPNELKARSRFFIDSDFETLWSAILNILKPNGRAYVLLRNLEDHGHQRFEDLTKRLGPFGKPSLLHSIRGTDLILFVKNGA